MLTGFSRAGMKRGAEGQQNGRYQSCARDSSHVRPRHRQHSVNDTIDGVDFGYLAQNARVNAAGVASLALAPPAAKATNARSQNMLSRDPSGCDPSPRWNASPGAVAYRVYWRDTWTNDWQQARPSATSRTSCCQTCRSTTSPSASQQSAPTGRRASSAAMCHRRGALNSHQPTSVRATVGFEVVPRREVSSPLSEPSGIPCPFSVPPEWPNRPVPPSRMTAGGPCRLFHAPERRGSACPACARRGVRWDGHAQFRPPWRISAT